MPQDCERKSVCSSSKKERVKVCVRLGLANKV